MEDGLQFPSLWMLTQRLRGAEWEETVWKGKMRAAGSGRVKPHSQLWKRGAVTPSASGSQRTKLPWVRSGAPSLRGGRSNGAQATCSSWGSPTASLAMVTAVVSMPSSTGRDVAPGREHWGRAGTVGQGGRVEPGPGAAQLPSPLPPPRAHGQALGSRNPWPGHGSGCPS